MSSGVGDDGRSRCSIHGDASIPSRRRKCTRPDCSPATIVTPSGATAQQLNALSPEKLAIASLLERFKTLRVPFAEPEITCLPSGVTATAFIESLSSVRVNSFSPVTRFQTLRVLSAELEITCL